MNNYGDLETALEEATSLDMINKLSDEELEESIKLDKIDIIDIFSKVDNSKILFSPQIEIFEPFAAHVDASRTNMSAKQLLQTVTSDNNDTPYILNKNYQAMTNINSPFVEYAKEDGIVLYSNYNFLVVYYLKSNEFKTIYCPKTKKMTNNTLTLKYKMTVEESVKFKKDDVLFDYTGQTRDGNVPNIGYRTKIMYGSFYGYTADDAFVMSESFADKTKIDYSKKIFVPITKEIKYLKNVNDNYFFKLGEISSENYTEYFKIDSSDSILSEFNNTSKKQSKIYGKCIDSIDGGEIVNFKVHRITKKTFDEMENEYIYTPDLIKEIDEQYERQIEIKKDLFLKFNTVFIDKSLAVEKVNEIFTQWESAETLSNMTLENISNDYQIEKENIDYVLEIEIYKSEPTCVGDKFANVYAGKGVVSLILPDELMPNNSDIIFNPLGLFGRNNWGTIFEIALAKIVRDIESCLEDKQSVINRIEFIRQNFIDMYDKEYSNKVLELLYSLDDNTNWKLFYDSVKTNGFYMFVSNFPGITFKTFIDNFINPYQKKFEINITQKEDIVYSKELMKYMRERGFISNVFEEDTIQDVQQEIFIGYNYWIKLFHTSYSKYNSISFANNYSKSTGEPPRGRIKHGGCHISWQTTAALMGHSENNPCSKELRTIKSDAIEDKNNFNRKMIQDGKYVMKDKYNSPTVNTLNNGLNMLCLKFSDIYDNNSDELFVQKSEITQDDELLEKQEDFDISELFTNLDENEKDT